MRSSASSVAIRDLIRRQVSVAVLWGGCLALVALGAFAASAAAQTDTTAVTIPGSPLTVNVGPLGECQSSYVVNNEVAGNYYFGTNPVGDCGFFLAFPSAPAGQPGALKGKTFGFEGRAGPGSFSEQAINGIYMPVPPQSPVTGAGTEASPYSQTTTFKVQVPGEEFARITETTTYVNGSPQFTSSYSVKNVTSPPGKTIYFRAMYAGDLYVNGNDHGTGVFLGGPPRFIGGQNTASGVLGGFVEAPGALEWSSWQEAYWAGLPGVEGAAAGDEGIWKAVTSTVDAPEAFNKTIEPLELDNGAAVEWDQRRTGSGLAQGESQAFTIINRTTIPSGLQVNPVNQTLTQGQAATIGVTAVDTAGVPLGGKALRYTISGANPQSGAVALSASGQAQISFAGANPGIDTVQMYVDLANSGVRTASDPGAAATVTWLPKPPPGPPAPNSSYKVQSIHANANGTITITFVPAQAGQATLEVTVPTGTIARKQAEAAKKKRCKKGLVRIKSRCLRPTTLSGKVTATGTAGVPLKLTVGASRKVKAALKKGRTVKLTAKLTYKSVYGGNPTVQTFVLTVKPPKKHRKH